MSDWALVHDEGNGWGHQRRMRALGRSLEARGASPSLHAVGDAVRSPRVVVDSYRVRADDRSRFEAETVVALDDLARDLDVDLLVDPSPGAEPGSHPSASAVLAGADYAVVDPGIRELEVRPVGGAVRRVLVSFGAADTEGLGATVAAEIVRLMPETVVEVPVGPWWEGPVPDGVHAVSAPDGLAPRLALADLAVIGGGVTLLEALTLSRPTVAVLRAENQRTALEHAASADALILSGIDEVATEAASLAADTRRRAELSGNGGRLIDGRGADRVADEVLRLS